MYTLIYDGSFEGFLSSVFYVYEYKLAGVKIATQLSSPALFGQTISVPTEKEKAERIWTGLSEKISKEGLHTLYSSYLADTLQEEDNMLAYIQHVFSSR